MEGSFTSYMMTSSKAILIILAFIKFKPRFAINMMDSFCLLVPLVYHIPSAPATRTVKHAFSRLICEGEKAIISGVSGRRKDVQQQGLP